MWYLPGKGTGEWRGGPKWVPEGTDGAVQLDMKLKVEDIDYGRFKDDDPPPFYDLNAQRVDRPMTASEITVERERFVVSHVVHVIYTFTHTHTNTP